MDDLRKDLKEAEAEIEQQRQEITRKNHEIKTIEGGIMVPRLEITPLLCHD